MNKFDVWMEFFEGEDFTTTNALTINSLNAKQALFQGFSMLQPYIPEGLGVDDISIYVQLVEEEDEEDE